jgi:HK97 family phage prohead protease
MQMAKTEFRTITGVNLRSADDNEFALQGVAAAYDVPSAVMRGGPTGTFVEKIARGAFGRSLRAKADTKALFNHDPNHVLGRVKNGTLRLTDTAAGLSFRVQLNPKSETHQNIYRMVQSGLIDECSFAFTLPDKGGDKWSGDGKTRTLLDVNLNDVSIVTTPAYPSGTSVSVRSAPKAGGTYRLDWQLTAAMRLAALDEQYEQTIRKLEEGK